MTFQTCAWSVPSNRWDGDLVMYAIVADLLEAETLQQMHGSTLMRHPGADGQHKPACIFHEASDDCSADALVAVARQYGNVDEYKLVVATIDVEITGRLSVNGQHIKVGEHVALTILLFARLEPGSQQRLALRFGRRQEGILGHKSAAEDLKQEIVVSIDRCSPVNDWRRDRWYLETRTRHCTMNFLVLVLIARNGCDAKYVPEYEINELGCT